MNYTVLFWLIAFAVFLIVEAATYGLTSIYFAFGALAALICAVIDPKIIWLQVVLFIIVSAVTLYFTRPLAKKYVNVRHLPTNADRVLNMIGIVTEDINNIEGTGAVSVGGKIWTARSLTGVNIAKGERVRSKSIEGVKLIVMPLSGNTDEAGEKAAKTT